MDTLPHNGAVIILLAVTGLTHRQAYKDVFMITSTKTAAVAIAVYYLDRTLLSRRRQIRPSPATPGPREETGRDAARIGLFDCRRRRAEQDSIIDDEAEFRLCLAHVALLPEIRVLRLQAEAL